MAKTISDERWEAAQKAEKISWIRTINFSEELLRFIYEKYVFLGKIKANCPQSLIPPSGRLGEALEIGIGPLRLGVVTLLEPIDQWNITGIDPLEEMELKHAPKHIVALYQYLRNRSPLKFFQTSAEKLQFESAQFDLIVCYNVLDHTLNPYAILDEIHRVLRPGGYFLLGLDALSLANWVRHKLFIKDVHHPYKFTSWHVENLLPKHRFKIIYLEKQRRELLLRLIAQCRRLTVIGQKSE